MIWQFLSTAILLTVVVHLPVELLLTSAGLRSMTPDSDPLGFACASLVSVTAGLWSVAAFLRVIDGRRSGREVSWLAALFETLDSLPWLLLNMAAIFVAVAAAMLSVMGLVAMAAVTATIPAWLTGVGSGISGFSVAVAIILLAALIAALIWIGSLMVRWTLVTPVVVLEGRRWGLERSSLLTRGSRWRCFGVMAVVSAALAVGLALVVGLLLLLGDGPEQLLRAMATGTNIALQLAFGLLGLLFSAAYYVLWRSLRGEDVAVTTSAPAGSSIGEPELPSEGSSDNYSQ